MLSIGELLLKEKSRREEFKDDYPDISDFDFYTIDLIDPSYFDSHHNIISLFLAKLYAKYKSKVNNDEKINENLKISFLNALTTAQNHAKMLLERPPNAYSAATLSFSVQRMMPIGGLSSGSLTSAA